MSAPVPPKTTDGKRRLPLFAKVEVAEEADLERPPWHWSVIGAIATFAGWLPLAFLVNAALKLMLPDGTEGAAPPASVRALMAFANAAVFALACFGGGLLVGRFGGRAGPREARAGGLAVGMIAWALAAFPGARSGFLIWAMLLAAMVGLGAFFASFGGKRGFRGRAP